MAKTSYQIEQEFLQGLEKTTGRQLEEWMQIIKESGHSTRNDILDWLKVNHDFRHVNASLLAGVFMNGGQPVYADDEGLLADQFKKKEHLKPIYTALVDKIMESIPETEIIIKKTYSSLNAKREYAAIGIKSKEIRLAMDLDGEPGGLYEKQTGIGCMPRISHMIKIVDESQIDDGLLADLKSAFDRMK
ncbi:MAG: DUF5655 domain-containing protein [Bacteroidota bacterium]